MAEKTKIEWCNHTFNPWLGCSKVNEGCQHCYAEQLMANRYKRVAWGEDGTRSRTKTWGDPLKWDRHAKADGWKHKVFCASLADVFESRDDLIDWREDLFKLIDRCQHLHWLLLTKRPENIVSMWRHTGQDNGFTEYGERENVWLGTSIANQRNTEPFIDNLLSARNLAPVLFLSVEPQIGPVNLRPWLFPEPLIHWVIVGGESAQGCPARPFHEEWASDLVDQCKAAEVPVFVKQMGSNFFRRGRPYKLRDGHGGDMSEWPEHLRVRECPESFYATAR